MLSERGHGVEIRGLDGYAADIRTEDGYEIDVKIAKPSNGRLAIAADEFEWQGQEYGDSLRYAVICRAGKVRWFTHAALTKQMIGGRRPPTANGSNTDWFLFDVQT